MTNFFNIIIQYIYQVMNISVITDTCSWRDKRIVL